MDDISVETRRSNNTLDSRRKRAQRGGNFHVVKKGYRLSSPEIPHIQKLGPTTHSVRLESRGAEQT